MAPTLETTVGGILVTSPFGVASGSLLGNEPNIRKAAKTKIGFLVPKTSSRLRPTVDVRNKIVRVGDSMQNIEGIAPERLDEHWLPLIGRVLDDFPELKIVFSFMEPYKRDAWLRTTEMLTKFRSPRLGVRIAGLEENFGCPQDVKEDGMGEAMGQIPETAGEVTGWVKSETDLPIWAKLTVNGVVIAKVAEEIFKHGCHVTAINTVGVIWDVDLDTEEPQPANVGHSTPGGGSGEAIFGIALKAIRDCAQVALNYPGCQIIGSGGAACCRTDEDRTDPAKMMLLGASGVQLYTAMTRPPGFSLVDRLNERLLAYVVKKDAPNVASIVGRSLKRVVPFKDLLAMDLADYQP